MNIIEVERSLPNGFHDASIVSISVDYSVGEARLVFLLWVGYEDSTKDDKHDSGRPLVMKSAELLLRGLAYLVMQASPTCSMSDAEPIDVSGYEGAPDGVTLPKVDVHTVVYSFYVDGWNSSIICAAREAELRWL